MASLTIDDGKVEQQTSAIISQANELAVLSNEDYSAAGEFLKGVKGLQKEIDSTFDPIISKLHEAHKEALAQKRRHSDPVRVAEQLVKGKMVGYLDEQDRKRRVEEQRLQKLRREDEEKRRLDEALVLEAEGKKEEAEELIEEPIETAPVILENDAPKVEGVSKPRVTWKFRIVDAKKVPREFLTVDEKKIGGVVRATKGELKIPGVEVYPEKIIAAKAD